MISFDGRKYILNVVIDGNGDTYCEFFIQAVDKTSRKSSCINNINAILSLLEVDSEDSTYEDSRWDLNKQEAEQFYAIAVEALSDLNYLAYLEGELDEDREEGEWANTA